MKVLIGTIIALSIKSSQCSGDPVSRQYFTPLQAVPRPSGFGSSLSYGAPQALTPILAYPQTTLQVDPRPSGFGSSLLKLIRVLLVVRIINDRSTTTTTTTPAATTTTTAPFSDWTTVTLTDDSICRFKLYEDSVTWDSAKSICESNTNAKLASTRFNLPDDRTRILAAVPNYRSGVPLWVGFYDPTSNPTNAVDIRAENLASVSINPQPVYNSLVGVRGCGYYGSNIPDSGFVFDTCILVTPTTPSTFLCELC